jgi:genome maintenance exonuclease 1
MFNYCPPVQIGDIESKTFPDGKRYYTLPDGTRLPSITTILGAKPKKELMEWRQRVGAEEANRITRTAASKGTKTHTICEKYLNNDPNYLQGVMPDSKFAFKSIKPYLDKINNIHYQEQALWSLTLGAAGRVDCIAEYDGVLSVIDFKTSRRHKKREDIMDYFYQTTAYACMYQELVGTPIHQSVVIMAVDSSSPLIFIEDPADHVEGLVEAIQYYKNTRK